MDLLSKPITLENYSPVYALYGDEFFLRDRVLSHIRKPFLEAPMGDLNHEKFDIKESPLANVIAAAQSLPMMGSARLIEVRGVEILKANEIEPLLRYIEQPNKTTCIVLIGESVDKKKKLFKILDKKKILFQFKIGNKRSFKATIKRECELRNFSIGAKEITLIAEFLGDQDLGLVLDKLALYKGASREGASIKITENDIILVVGSEGQAAIFSFIDFLFAMNLNESLLQLRRLIENNENPVLIITMITRQLRFLLFSKANSGKLAPGAPPFLKSKLNAMASKYNYNKLYHVHEATYEADKKIKSSRVDRNMILENLVFTWCL